MLCDKKHSHVQWRDFKMNVLVCDDDQQIVDSIIEEFKKKSEETHVALRFYGFSQPSQIDLSLPYDIALLDIDMGETNGIELARKLRAENENIVIIFITNFIQYAPEGFEVQAFRYLLKSDLPAKLYSYFDSAVHEALQRKQLVTISINSEIIDVPVNDILYLESHRRIIAMHLLDESRPAYKFLMILTKQYCGISNGSACTSKSYSPSYVLLAMGVPVEQIENSVRISWGADTDPDLLKAEFSKMLSMAKKLAQ